VACYAFHFDLTLFSMSSTEVCISPYTSMLLCEKNGKCFVSLLLQNGSILSVAYFTWNFKEICPNKSRILIEKCIEQH